MKKKLILFDFDGTITTKDTFIEFIRFYHGPVRFNFGRVLLLPVMVLYATKLIPNWKAKEIVIRWFFQGQSLERFDAQCREFTARKMNRLIRPEALKQIEIYKKENHEIAVVSASAENWVKPWCDAIGIPVIATRLQVVNNTITGKLDGPNCFGPEKAVRIRERYNLADYESVVAYGDSSGDTAMLALATEKHYKPFRN